MARKLKIVKADSTDAKAAQYLADAGENATAQGLREYLAKQGIVWTEDTVRAFGSRIKGAAVDTVATIKAQRDDEAKVSATAKAANTTVKALREKMDSRIAFWQRVSVGQSAAFPKQSRQGRTAASEEEKLLSLLG